MGFSNFKFNVLGRIVILTATIFIFVYLIYGDSLMINYLIVLGLVGIQIASLLKYLDKTNNEVLSFLDSIKHDDIDHKYTTTSENEAINKLNEEFNKVVERFRDIRKEKEADFQYLKNIIQHIGIGLITFKKADGEIQIFNTSAKRLLRINQASNVKDLKEINPTLLDIITRLKTGGRDLITMEIGGELVQLAVYAIELTLRGEEYKLISLQNIQSELEEKEMEAWQNLVRVLTHEIMNSITPISSLAATVESDLNERGDKPMSDDDIEDLHTALQTIQKRSSGLIRFVQDFRNLTHTPKPQIKLIKVSEVFEQISMLMKKELEENQITMTCSVEPESLTLNADKELIEQVIINLVQNAAQAFDEEKEDKNIELTAYQNEKSRPVISVKDNGTGIDEEAMLKIFIPFFTTKKSGSGIGLSLSRQIMRQHQGSLNVRSKMDEGTEFLMKF